MKAAMKRPALAALQTPAGQPLHFDRSRPAPQTDILRAAWMDGLAHGASRGYIKGWRYGVRCGICTTLALATLLLGVSAGLGWL